MRKSRFTEGQIVAIFKEHAARGRRPADVIRRHGISRETFYKWRRQYGGLQVDKAKRLQRSPAPTAPTPTGSGVLRL
jgi:putative transposase